MTKVPDEVIRLAVRICKKSEMRQQMAAVIYDNNHNIINVGYNRWLVKRSPRSTTNFIRYSIHAEIDALRGCSRRELWGANIYIHRNNGKLAKPCVNCTKILTKYGISNVYWSG